MRFSIRDMAWLTLVAALAIFVWLQRAEIEKQRAKPSEAYWQGVIKASERDKDQANAACEALLSAVKQADMSDEQRKSIGDLWLEEMKRRGIEPLLHQRAAKAGQPPKTLRTLTPLAPHGRQPSHSDR